MRGKMPMLPAECEFCNKPLPDVRHPSMRFCTNVCYQRDKWQRTHPVGNGIKCLECGKVFTRVGSHVVQVHGYENVNEYRKEHGLMSKETRTKEHAELMREKIVEKSVENLGKGKSWRFTSNDNHVDELKQFWNNWNKHGRKRK